MLAVEWSNVHLAGAFLLGTIFGTITTLRIVRHVTAFFGGTSRHRRPDEDGA